MFTAISGWASRTVHKCSTSQCLNNKLSSRCQTHRYCYIFSSFSSGMSMKQTTFVWASGLLFKDEPKGRAISSTSITAIFSFRAIHLNVSSRCVEAQVKPALHGSILLKQGEPCISVFKWLLVINERSYRGDAELEDRMVNSFYRWRSSKTIIVPLICFNFSHICSVQVTWLRSLVRSSGGRPLIAQTMCNSIPCNGAKYGDGGNHPQTNGYKISRQLVSISQTWPSCGRNTLLKQDDVFHNRRAHTCQYNLPKVFVTQQ